MAAEYKALTVINLPFTEERFLPGQMIPHEAFERSAEAASEQLDDHSGISDAEAMISALIEGGSLSEDEGAELHPDHMPRTPGELSVQSVADSAKALVAQLEADGKPVPVELQAMAEVDVRAVESGDKGNSNDALPKKTGKGKK